MNTWIQHTNTFRRSELNRIESNRIKPKQSNNLKPQLIHYTAYHVLINQFEIEKSWIDNVHVHAFQLLNDGIRVKIVNGLRASAGRGCGGGACKLCAQLIDWSQLIDYWYIFCIDYLLRYFRRTFSEVLKQILWNVQNMRRLHFGMICGIYTIFTRPHIVAIAFWCNIGFAS